MRRDSYAGSGARLLVLLMCAALAAASGAQAASAQVFAGPSPAPLLTTAEQEAEEREAEAPPAAPPAPSEASASTAVPDEAAAWGENNNFDLGAGYKDTFTSTPVAVAALSDAKAVATGYHFGIVLLGDGSVQTWGGNSFGQLGNGSRESSPQPVTVPGLSGVKAIAAGGAHALALLGNGTVVTWGGDAYGELGNGTSGRGRANGTSSTVPVAVPGLTGVVAVAAGGGDDFVLLANGTLEAWGENKDGQLGDGTTVEKDVPTPVRAISAVKAIAVGGDPSLGGHVLALLDNGTVMAWGANGAGQLGNGSTTNSLLPVPVKGLANVTAVTASVSHSMALLSDGTVRAWGNDNYGEIGAAPDACRKGVPCSTLPILVSGVRNVSAISAGFRFSLAVSGGRAFAWGLNAVGQLGDQSTANSAVPVQAGSLTDVSAISAGEHQSVALLDGAGLVPNVEGTPGAGSITVSWHSSEQPPKWRISWRPVQQPAAKWGRFVSVAASTRSYAVTGLSAAPYEVMVQSKGAGARVVRVTPLA